MTDIFELIRQKCPDGVPIVQIKSFCKVGTGSSNGNEAVEDGDYPFYVRSETVFRKDDYEFDETAIVIPGEGSIGDVFHYVEGKYALHQRAYRIHATDENVFMKYVYYYMLAYFKTYITRQSVDGTVASIRKPMIEKFAVPLPPLQIQREIVAILDKFDMYCNDMTAGLAGELEMRRKQYRYWAEVLLSNPAYQQVKAGSLFARVRTKAKNVPGGKVCTISNTKGIIPKEEFGSRTMTSEDTSKYLSIPADGIGYRPMGLDVGTIGLNKLGVPAYVSPAYHGFTVDKSRLMPEYLMIWLRTDMFDRQREQLTEEGARKKFDYDHWNKITMPLPDLQEQARLVSILGKFRELEHELEHELELRRKQYEYYRDMLLSFPERKENA